MAPPEPSALPDPFAATRSALQAVATHVLARGRAAVTGRFGLRVTPGGFGTPAFGDDEVLRVSGRWLLRERRVDGALTTAVADLATTSLSGAADLAGVDLGTPFEAGHDTPPQPDPDAPLAVDGAAATVLADWFDLGWRALDVAVAGAGPSAAPTAIQLWPEHFDVGVDLAVGTGPDGQRRANLGASPGDAGHPAPYLYVGPWGPERPGDPSFWNAGFGAVLGCDEVRRAEDPLALAVVFLTTGLAHLGDDA